MDKISSRRVTWIDIENPTDREISELAKTLSIHPFVAQEILVATYRQKLDDYDDYLYLVLHFPVFDPHASSSLRREIDFVIFPYTLITIHYEPIPKLDEFQQLLGGHESLRERKMGSSSGYLLYQIINQLYLVSQKELDSIEEKAKVIEEKIFNGFQREILKDIAFLRRDLINFQKALKPQEAVLDSLEEHGRHFFGEDIQPYFSDIKGEYMQVRNSVNNLKEMLDSLYDTNISLLSVHSNETMKALTAIAAIMLPVTLLANIFGMNIPGVPLSHNPHAFSIALGMMILVSFCTYMIFKNSRWL